MHQLVNKRLCVFTLLIHYVTRKPQLQEQLKGCRNYTIKIISEAPPAENNEGHVPHCKAIAKTEDRHSPKLYIKIPVLTEKRTHSQTCTKTDRLRPFTKTVGVLELRHPRCVTDNKMG